MERYKKCRVVEKRWIPDGCFRIVVMSNGQAGRVGRKGWPIPTN